MKRFAIFLSALAVLGLLLAGCSLGSTDADGQEDADGIAAMAADPADGLTQEVADIGGYLFGGGGPGAEQKAFGLPDQRARFFSGDLGNFTWNPVSEAYERTRTSFDLVLPTRSVHVNSVFVQVRFFTSTDATGESYQPADITSGLDPAVHSLTYSRTIDAGSTNLSTGTVNAFTADSDFTFSDIDTILGTVIINGTRSRTFDKTFTSGRTVIGTITDAVSGLSITWDAGAGSMTWSGTVTYVYDATVARVNGTEAVRHREGTITFSGSSTFTVTVDGTDYEYNLSDGSPVG